MTEIPDFINDVTRYIQLGILLTKCFSDNPVEGASIVSNSLSVTAQKLNVSVEFVERIVQDRITPLTDESDAKEQAVFNLYNFLIEKTLSARQ